MKKGDEKTRSDVRKYGWQVLGVFEDETGPAFAYTIGLYQTFKHPEVLMIGLELEFMQGILNNIGDDIKSGRRYEAGRAYPGIVENYDCSFQKIDEQFYGEYLGTAIRFYKRRDFPAFQCVFPDMKGCFPWDKGVNPELLEMQPVLTEHVKS
ncbi:MAG: DUF4262 domain-containing protein [Pyrinomonadaceae bacterium]